MNQAGIALGHAPFAFRRLTKKAEALIAAVHLTWTNTRRVKRALFGLWYLATGVDKALFEDTLALFAREVGAGRDRIIILVLDGAVWHTAQLSVPEGIRLVHLPSYTPELQPAETLWVHVDQPIVNLHFESLAELDAVVADRRIRLFVTRSRAFGTHFRQALGAHLMA